MLINILNDFEFPSYFLLFLSILLKKLQRCLDFLKPHSNDMFSYFCLNFIHSKLKSDSGYVSLNIPGDTTLDGRIGNRSLGEKLSLEFLGYLLEQSLLLGLNYLKMILFN